MTGVQPLIQAAKDGNDARVRELLKKGGYEGDPRVRDNEGRTAIHYAALRNYIQIVDHLVKMAGGPQLLLLKDMIGCTPVHLAGVQNQVGLVMHLMDVLRNDDGSSPLHESARLRCLQDFMSYLHHGWSIGTAVDEDKVAATDVHARLWQTIVEADGRFAKKGLRQVAQTLCWTPLHASAIMGDVTLIRSLVTEHKLGLMTPASNQWTALHYAAAYNKVDAIEELIRLGCPIDAGDHNMLTPVHVAAAEGHLEAVKLFLEKGWKPNGECKGKHTVIYSAAQWRQVEMVRYLHSLNCPPVPRGEGHRTPVHVAAELGWTDLLQILIEELKFQVAPKDQMDTTPLHLAAHGGHVEAVQLLLNLQHPLDIVDKNGRNPLHLACISGRVGAAKELILRGADVSARDGHKYTPLHLAAEGGHCQMIVLLHENGADLEAVLKDRRTPLAVATYKACSLFNGGTANVEAIGTLIRLGAKVEPVLTIHNVESPLHVAARCGRLEVVEDLVKAGIPVTVRTKDGSTALHYAAAFGQAHIIKALVRLGCDVNVRDDAKNTPLHLAAGCGFLETVIELATAGADLNARDVTKCTPLQNAAHGTYSAMAATPPAPKLPASAYAGTKEGRTASGVSSLFDGKCQGRGSMQRGKGLGSAAASLSLPEGGSGAELSTQAASELAFRSTPPVTGMVPVRTGLAWATLAAAAGVQNASDLIASFAPDLDAELHHEMRRTQFGSFLNKTMARPFAKNGHKYSAFGHSYASHGSHAAWDSSTALHHRNYADRGDSGLDALLQQTQALKLANTDQNRKRLIVVVEKLVELGASVSATDSEGRTAMHLAAGCGDTDMVIKLLQLGTDINCRDTVGGTAMHHAAMANGKDMMVELARMGCDPRTKAEGIDGATASFVYCGQHGKNNYLQAQSLIDTKLRKAFAAGEKLRREGVDTLATPKPDGGAQRTEEIAAIAEANAEKLLQQEADEASREAERKAKKKKKKKAAGEPDSRRQSEDGGGSVLRNPKSNGAQESAALPAEDISTLKLGDNVGRPHRHPASTNGRKSTVNGHRASEEGVSNGISTACDVPPQSLPSKSGVEAALGMESPAPPASLPSANGHLDRDRAPHPGTSTDKSKEGEPKRRRSVSDEGSKALKGAEAGAGSGKASRDVLPVPVPVPQKKEVGACSEVAKEGEECSESSESETRAIKDKLDSACSLAAGITEMGSQPTETELRGALDGLDEAIAHAEEAKVSAKYGKKCRRKVQAALDNLLGHPFPGSVSPANDSLEISSQPTSPPVQLLHPADSSLNASSTVAPLLGVPHAVANGSSTVLLSPDLPRASPHADAAVLQAPHALHVGPKATVLQSPAGPQMGAPPLLCVNPAVTQVIPGPRVVAQLPPPAKATSRMAHVGDAPPAGPRPKTAPPLAKLVPVGADLRAVGPQSARSGSVARPPTSQHVPVGAPALAAQGPAAHLLRPVVPPQNGHPAMASPMPRPTPGVAGLPLPPHPVGPPPPAPASAPPRGWAQIAPPVPGPALDVPPPRSSWHVQGPGESTPHGSVSAWPTLQAAKPQVLQAPPAHPTVPPAYSRPIADYNPMQSRSILGQDTALIHGLAREGSSVPSADLVRPGSGSQPLMGVEREGDTPDANQLELDFLPKGLLESREDDVTTPRAPALGHWGPSTEVPSQQPDFRDSLNHQGVFPQKPMQQGTAVPSQPQEVYPFAPPMAPGGTIVGHGMAQLRSRDTVLHQLQATGAPVYMNGHSVTGSVPLNVPQSAYTLGAQVMSPGEQPPYVYPAGASIGQEHGHLGRAAYAHQVGQTRRFTFGGGAGWPEHGPFSGELGEVEANGSLPGRGHSHGTQFHTHHFQQGSATNQAAWSLKGQQ